jgi:phage protein D
LAHPSAHRLIPDCRVSIAGKKLPPEKDAALTRVDVDLDADLFGQCILTFNDPHLALINGKDFRSGTAVKVEIGFHTKLKRIFEGEVVALEPIFRRDAPPSLKVVCQESLHRLALCQMTRAFNDVDDKEIATKIAREHGLTAQAPAGTKEHILQGNVTDAAFLRRLAGKSGNTLRIEGKKLIIGPPPKGRDVQVGPGDGLKKIKVKIKANTQVGEVTVHAWDPKTKKEITAKAKPTGATHDGAKKHGGSSTLAIAGHEVIAPDVATAEKMAKGRLRKIAEGFIQAHGDIIGNPEVIPGAVLNLDKMGAQVDGQYRVEHAIHAFSKHGYWVNFKAVRIGKKKPAKPQKHTWSTEEGKGKDAEEVVIGPDGKPVVRRRDATPGSTKWHKPRLRNLVLAYDEGKSVDEKVDDDWDNRKHGLPKLEDLELAYRWRTRNAEHDPDDPEFQKVKNLRLEKLKFGYAGQAAPTKEQLEEGKKAEHQPRLEKLEESYKPGKGDPDEAV